MAVSNKDCDLLFYAKSIGVSFQTTLMLGRLKLNASPSHLNKCFDKYQNHQFNKTHSVIPLGEYAETLFLKLDAEVVESIDYSDYEGATIIHDMNTEITTQFHSRFSTVVDGGTLEHIFNFPVAIRNCMEMLKVGGHFIGITPANNQMGHGFYQFSPELYYRVFSKENGFRIRKMFITSIESTGNWYEVADPAIVKSRIMLSGGSPLSLAIIAEKITNEIIFKIAPLQSDYENVWNISTALQSNTKPKGESRLVFFYRRYFPSRLKKIFHLLYRFLFVKTIESQELGIYNSKHFRKVNF